MKNTQDAYKAILKLLKKHKDEIVFDVEDLETRSKKHLFGLELKEVYGLDLDPKKVDSLDWIRLNEFVTIGMFDGVRRSISWSDNGEQPIDEYLLNISFSTGPYIFGEDYPIDLFQKFYNELAAFNPDYSDTNNRNLYFKLENAKGVFNAFKGILSKYHEINKEDYKLRKIAKMKADLLKMESSK